jgi:hypothetical protein
MNFQNLLNRVNFYQKTPKQYADILNKYGALTDSEKKAEFAKSNDAEYQYNLAKFQNDKANGDITRAQELDESRKLRKEKVGSTYEKQVRDLYEVTETELGDWLKTKEDGVDKKKIYDQLVAYDKALKGAGLIKYLKYKNGIANSSQSSGGSGSGSKAKKSYTFSDIVKKSTTTQGSLRKILESAKL